MIDYNKIAVIDDGINLGFYNNILCLDNNVEIDINCNVGKHKNTENEYSHGTACASIINKYTEGAIISSIKIINETSKTTSKQLLKGIEWCLENNIGIINISLGTIDLQENDELCAIVNKAAINGIIIVAAVSNENKVTLPASLSNVIGVKTLDNEELRGYLYNYDSMDGVDILAPSIHNLTNRYEEEKTLKCNSFATPYITAKVHNIIDKKKFIFNPIEIKYLLSMESNNYMDKLIVHVNLDWIYEGIVFYLNAPYRYSKGFCKYNFKIIKEVYIYCDNKIEQLGLMKKWINEIGNDSFDTLIIRDFNERKCDLNYFAENLFYLKKGLVYINDICPKNEKLKVKYERNLWYTGINEEIKFLNKTNIPVVLVLGDNEKEILRALQLEQYFKINQYRSSIYTDSSWGLLYGAKQKPVDNFNNDIIIYFLEYEDRNFEYTKSLIEKLGIDVIVNFSSCKFKCDGEKYFIQLINEENIKMEEDCEENIFIVNDIYDIYKKIVDLYSEE